MTPQRITPAYLARITPMLSPRDWLIMAVLGRVRVATTSQVQRLCYPDNTPLSGARMARRALRRLVELRVLARLDRAPGGRGGGRPGDVYSLDAAGLRLLTRDHRPVRRPWPVSRLFLAHALSVTNLFCQLTEADRRGKVELLDLVTEPRSWRTFAGPGGGSVTLKPDAFARLRQGGWESYLFLEIDRGTEGPTALRRQLDLYIRYWQTGTEQACHEVFPAVIWIVPSAHRHAQVVDLLGRLPPATWALFRVVTEADALTLLTRIEGEP